MRKRTTTDVIDQAIIENSSITKLLCFFVSAFVVVGLGLIVHGVITQSLSSGAVGAFASALCYPAIHYLRIIRQENIALRILEVPLNNANTSEEAANMVHKLMEKIYTRKGRPDE